MDDDSLQIDDDTATDAPVPTAKPRGAAKRHTRRRKPIEWDGINSVVSGVIVAAVLIALIVLARRYGRNAYGQWNESVLVSVGAMLLILLAVNIAGLVSASLAISRTQGRSRVAITGLILNILTLLPLLAIFLTART